MQGVGDGSKPLCSMQVGKGESCQMKTKRWERRARMGWEIAGCDVGLHAQGVARHNVVKF